MFTFGFGLAILSYKNKSNKERVPYLFPHGDLSDDGTMAFRSPCLFPHGDLTDDESSLPPPVNAHYGEVSRR